MGKICAKENVKNESSGINKKPAKISTTFGKYEVKVDDSEMDKVN